MKIILLLIFEDLAKIGKNVLIIWNISDIYIPLFKWIFTFCLDYDFQLTYFLYKEMHFGCELKTNNF